MKLATKQIKLHTISAAKMLWCAPVSTFSIDRGNYGENTKEVLKT